MTKTEYEEIANLIIAQMNASPSSMDYASCLLRLAGHDLMDFRREPRVLKNGKIKYTWNSPKKSGGSDGCVNFSDEDNKGLPTCLHKSNLNSIYEKYCGKVGLADFMVLAAEAVTGGLAVDSKDFSAGTLLSQYRDQFRYGRDTMDQCPLNVGLMPNPENSCTDLNEIFINNIFIAKGLCKTKRWGLTAAISGAHTLGSAKVENSGYKGFWSDPVNSGILDRKSVV